jgi:hypothetical protein
VDRNPGYVRCLRCFLRWSFLGTITRQLTPTWMRNTILFRNHAATSVYDLMVNSFCTLSAPATLAAFAPMLIFSSLFRTGPFK